MTTPTQWQHNPNLNCSLVWHETDLEKAGACGHFVGSYDAILRIFLVKYPLTEDGWRRVEDRDLRLDQGDLR